MKKNSILISILCTITLSVLTPTQQAKAAIAINQGFNPSVLIADTVFTDTKTFGGSAGIQKFLEKKGSILANTSPDFLVKLREPGFADLKTKLEDPNPNLGRLRTAAELIWDAGIQSGINPQVILVTLQKEQGLITNDPKDKTQRALDYALGFGCPDNQACNQILAGFYFQLFGAVDSDGERYLGAAKSLMRGFNIPAGQAVISLGGKQGRVGEVFEFGNTTDPYGVPSTQQVLISNRATAALYRYTPHVFNGNYNFWKYFNEWFRYPNGTIMQVSGDTNKYIIQNGSRFLLPNFVAQARGLDTTQTVTVSLTEVESYPSEKNPLGPANDTIINIIGDTSSPKYVFIDNIKHPASEFVIKQRKLDPSKSISITPEESALFSAGDQLTPSEGTILRGNTDQTVYKVVDGKLKAFSNFTFKQHKITSRQISNIPDTEISSYTKDGFVAPLDGSIIKSEKSAEVYEIKDGKKLAFSGEIFKNRGIAAKNIAVLSSEEVNGITTGAASPTPKEATFYQVKETGEQYFFKGGETHHLLPLVIKQQKITPDFTFSQNEHSSWKKGVAVSPKEGSILKGDKDSTVYIVSGKKLKPLTAQAYKNRKITAKKITMVPQAEMDEYEKGEVLSK